MRRPSLRSQLNQVRLWVRQGRTDAWIAHKLDISLEQLDQFKREHKLDDEPPGGGPEPADEPAPAAAAVEPDEIEEPWDEAPEPEEEALEPQADEPEPTPEPEELAREQPEEPARRRRRGRRGGRRRAARTATSYEGTFDHGTEGYGLWLDPAVADNEVYTEHWAGHRAVDVTVEPDAITIRRVEGAD